MVRRFHRSIYDELDELRASMDYLYQLALEPADYPLVLPEDNPGIVCRYAHNLNAEVTLQEEEVTVTVDMAAGTGTSKISVDLIDETTLKICCDQEEEEREDMARDTLREQRSFSLAHIIPLPDPVVREGARISLIHGVLDIHLKKMLPARA
jgi:HSP20 family molecular chaperone IbpA